MNKKALLAGAAFLVGALCFVNFFLYPKSVLPIWVTHPIGIIATAYLVIGFALPAVLGKARPLDPSPWPPVAVAKCGGHLGWVRFSGPLIKVTVYPDRLTLKPFLMGEYTIMGPEIRNVSTGRWRQLVIEHSAPGRTSPARLHGLADHVVAAIMRIDRNDHSAARRSSTF